MSAIESKVKLYPTLETRIQSLTQNFSAISKERRSILEKLTDFIVEKLSRGEKIELIYICTHNSRRSHISQVWTEVAAAYFGIPKVASYSGGTEATAFNPRAVAAIQRAGFKVVATSSGLNPVYEVSFSDEIDALKVFSKRYDATTNPQNGFAAVMTCSHADENCPVVLGMEKRISLPYDDPKDFDDTPDETAKYTERVNEIGTEILFAFSEVAKLNR